MEMQKSIAKTAQDLFGVEIEPELTRPDEQFGDYATNVALQLAGKVGKPPREIAEAIAAKLVEQNIEANVAGPGFINIKLSDQALLDSLRLELPKTQKGKSVVVEYSDPNPFKELHVGHLYDSVLGDAIANLLEAAGAEVHRVNFGGDVGLHVGKTLWAILQELGGENPEKLHNVNETDRPEWMAKAYVKGSNAYEDDQRAKTEIIELNHRVYQIQEQNDHSSPLAQIYWTTRQWSYDYFNAFYSRIGTHFEKYYPESQTAPVGLKAVREQQAKGVFSESNGAVVFNGDVHSLHTRVFINSKGLPTYETKDIGLALCKWQDYRFDRNIILTGNEIVEYMKVVLAALSQFEPEIVERTTHLTHGMVKLAGGTKMSSRKGNILRAVDVLDMTAEATKAAGNSGDEAIVLGAVKYAFVKQRMNADIVFDPDESVSLEGNSGPYLQYAHARAHSILAKAGEPAGELTGNLENQERSLVRKLSMYPETVRQATEELMPHHIATYLYELAQTFNRFYENNRVIGDEREGLRLKLVKTYAEVLANGLNLLGIVAPDQM